MAFVYTPFENFKPKPKEKLVLAGNNLPFYLPDIPCKTTYDIKINNKDSMFRDSENRLCGVQYEKLASGMKEKLRLLLSSEAIRHGM